MRQSTTLTPSQPNLVVGWASTIVQVWPAEDQRIAPPSPFRRPAAPLGSPEAVYELLAAVDGTDEVTYRRRHAAEAGAVLALTHHSEISVLEASLRVRGELSPSAMLTLLHDDDMDAQRLAS
jgi:hypothetical protein